MKVTITVDAPSKLHLAKELNSIVENITRFNRLDDSRTFLHGSSKVTFDGEFFKYAVVDRTDDYISFHNDRKDANEAAGEKYSVINMHKEWD